MITIICCKCGTTIHPNALNMCAACTILETNPYSSIKTHLSIEHCRQCDRYFTPPKSWAHCPWSSKELLMHLLNRNKTLQKFKLLDCDFLYTEEHSKQLKIKVVLEHGSVEINYKIRNMQCPDCQKIDAKQYWTSIVQVRQRVPHKKTLLYLEQLILEAKKFNDTTNIKERRDGIDFYYNNKTHALRFVNFIQSNIMSKLIVSERLISEDKKSNTAKYKFSYAIEIIPVCRDDLMMVSERIARKYGINRVNIVLKVNKCIKMIDPISMKITKVDGRNYWGYQSEYEVLMSKKNLRKFNIVEIDKSNQNNGKYNQCDVFLEKGNVTVHCKSHLGNLIKEGQTVLGYDFENSSMGEALDSNFKFFVIKREKKKLKRSRKIKEKKATKSENKNFNLEENDQIIKNLRNMEL